MSFRYQARARVSVVLELLETATGVAADFLGISTVTLQLLAKREGT